MRIARAAAIPMRARRTRGPGVSFFGLVVRFAAGYLCILFAAGIFTATTEAQTFAAHITADVGRDGKSLSIEIDAGRESTLQIRRGRSLLWQGVKKAWKPWKLTTADIDGDGKVEIIVGVTKSTKFFPKPHNCLFIYGWSGKNVIPKWLGSSLGRPFTDFLFVDLDDRPGDELLAVETTLDGKKVLSAYRWNSFGFTLDRQSETWRSARILGVEHGRISLEADGETIVLANDLTRSRL